MLCAEPVRLSGTTADTIPQRDPIELSPARIQVPGAPGSGKTTAARGVAARSSAAIIDHEVAKSRLLDADPVRGSQGQNGPLRAQGARGAGGSRRRASWQRRWTPEGRRPGRRQGYWLATWTEPVAGDARRA
jgi:hypothetical protein